MDRSREGRKHHGGIEIMDLNLRGRTALITGASKGIGRAIAAALVGGAMASVASSSNRFCLRALEDQEYRKFHFSEFVAAALSDMSIQHLADDLESDIRNGRNRVSSHLFPKAR